MLRVALHQGLAGLEERDLLVGEEQILGTIGGIRIVVNRTDSGATLLRGPNALAYMDRAVRIPRPAMTSAP